MYFEFVLLIHFRHFLQYYSILLAIVLRQSSNKIPATKLDRVNIKVNVIDTEISTTNSFCQKCSLFSRMLFLRAGPVLCFKLVV